MPLLIRDSNYVSAGGAVATHQAGDLLIAFQFNSTQTGVGWTPALTATGNTRSAVVAWKIAASSSETTSGFGGAACTVSLVGAKSANPIGGKAIDPGTFYNSNYWQIPGIALSKYDGSSIVLGWIQQDAGGFGFATPGDCTALNPYNPLLVKRNTATGAGINFGNGGNWGYSFFGAAQIEILAQPAAGFLAMF